MPVQLPAAHGPRHPAHGQHEQTPTSCSARKRRRRATRSTSAPSSSPTTSRSRSARTRSRSARRTCSTSSINLFAQNSLGNWTFNRPRLAQQRRRRRATSISAPAPTDPYDGLATFHASMYGLYGQDQLAGDAALSRHLRRPRMTSRTSMTRRRPTHRCSRSTTATRAACRAKRSSRRASVQLGRDG